MRKRLTASEGASRVADASTIGNPRKFKDMREYNIDCDDYPVPTLKETPADPRDEMGFGIPRFTAPKTASECLEASTLAMKLSYALLGDKVAEEVIEAQARDFLAMNTECLADSVGRFTASESLYIAEETVASEEVVAEEAVQAEEVVAEKKEEKTEEAMKAEEKTEDDTEAKKAEEKTEEETEAKKSEDETEAKKAEEVVAEEAVKSEEVVAEEAKKAEEAVQAETVEAKEEATEASLDVELTIAEEATTAEDEALLAELFQAGQTSTTASEKVVTASKEGVTTLGAQPVVASSSDVDNLSSLWKSAPDVSNIFS